MLNPILCLTGSQCSEVKMGDMYSNFVPFEGVQSKIG